MEPTRIPTIEKVKLFLEEYGWHFREIVSENKTSLISPYTLEGENKGVLISFKIEGEFVMVSTVDFLKNIPDSFTINLLSLNDKLKLIKIFVTSQNGDNTVNADVGFELWDNSWNKEGFFSFMDMLCLGIEKTIEMVSTENIPYQTNFVTFS